MKGFALNKQEPIGENVIPLAIQPKTQFAPPVTYREPFRLVPFTNRGGSQSWRVTGAKRDGTRIRENFSDLKRAEARKLELVTEWIAGHSETGLRATKLSNEQLRLAEWAFIRLGPGADAELSPAIELWLKTGRQQAVAESPRLDEASDDFLKWLDSQDCKLRPRTKDKLRNRVNLFRNSVPNLRVADISTEVIEDFLAGRDVSPLTKIGDLQAVSRFFSWCRNGERLGQKKRNRWVKVNPCAGIEIEKPTDGEPVAILTVKACKRLLAKAEKYRRGDLVPYLVVCLFAGLRPAEASRLTWANVNLADGEIRVEAQSTKVKKPRVVAIKKPLDAWLKAYQGRKFQPTNLRRGLDAIKPAAGYIGRYRGDEAGDLKPWPHDVLRHTSVSHFFRQSGSYGLTAEQFGNSEAIIKKHYQGRVSSKDTKDFYAIQPKKRGRN
jgi:integrase